MELYRSHMIGSINGRPRASKKIHRLDSLLSVNSSTSAMDQDKNHLLTDVILNHSRKTLDCLRLPWNPQPGSYLDLNGRTYAVLERRHRYQYTGGRYQLRKIALFVQATDRPSETSVINGQWVIGDVSCAYNAQSSLIRCAINPEGPCQNCTSYKPVAQ